MPCSSFARLMCSALCAGALLVPMPLRAAEPEASEAPPTTTPPPTTAPPADERPSNIGESSQDEIHDAMMRAFVERFQEGNFLYARGQYTQAAAEFERAFAAVPAEAALRNAVLSYERAGDRVSAALAARRYLALPSCDTPDIDKALCSAEYDKVAKQLERLMTQIGQVALKIDKGVVLREVFINNRKIAIADFPVLIAPGGIDVELVGALPGQRRQRLVDVRPGETQVINVGPFDVPDPDPRGQGGGRRPLQRPKWLKPLFWSGLGLTIASGAAMATMGALALREKRLTADNTCDGDPATPLPDCPMNGKDNYPHEHERRFGQYRTVSNALVGVTAGLALVSTVVAIIAFTGPDNRHKRNSSTQRASTRVRWLGAGVLVRW